jgi:hypothetical protein
MENLVLHPTSMAQWLALVHDAETAAAHRLDEELESYLVFLLMRFAGQPQVTARVLALEYLDGLLAGGRERKDRLRDVGDVCLLYSGLFPQMAARRRVRLSYFVQLGRTAYRELSDRLERGFAQVYLNLAHGFVPLMDVLQAMRTLPRGTPVLQPLEAFELWEDTGSSSARRSLRAVTDAVPVAGYKNRSPQ